MRSYLARFRCQITGPSHVASWNHGKNLFIPRYDLAITCIRPFACPSGLLRISSFRARPQVPFLAPLVTGKPAIRWRIARLLSTEKKRVLKKNLWDFANAIMVAIIAVPTLVIFMWWSSHEMMERDFPTPHEWSMRSRCYWHTIKAMQDLSVTQGRIPDWTLIGMVLELLVARLENKSIDGSAMVLINDTITNTPTPSLVSIDLASTYDITNLPEPAQRGYYQTLMEVLRTAEASQNILYDTVTKSIVLRDWVIGPSNTDPSPMPQGFSHIPTPREENCIQFFPSPDQIYHKLLGTIGFNDRQRIEISIAYGEWLDSLGRLQEAGEQFQLAVDTAITAHPLQNSIIDTSRGIIKTDAPFVTNNVLDTVTAQALHLAHRKTPASALPMILSVLQAYKASAVNASSETKMSRSYSGHIPEDVILAGLSKRLGELLSIKPVEYPAAPASGNEPLLRPAVGDFKEASIAIYAAELLFAASPKSYNTALAWVKDALEKADEGVRDTSLSIDTREQCVKCISIGLSTWSSIIQQLKTQAQSTPALIASSSTLPMWQREESDHWNWVKKVERDDWKTKLEWEQWKLWALFPRSTLAQAL